MIDVGPYTRKQLMETFAHWHMSKEYAEPMYNYLVYGFSPGGFFTSVLANDWSTAIVRSHPANTVEALKAVTGWIHDQMPKQALGSYEAVDAWCRMSDTDRQKILLDHRLILESKQEVLMALKGLDTIEPVLW